MRHNVKSRTLGRYGSHRMAMLRNLAASLILHGRIKTTLPRAKEVRSFVEKLITRARGGTLHDFRVAQSRMPHKEALKRLFRELGPKYKHRPGGYTRIVKLYNRIGDGAQMALLELVD